MILRAIPASKIGYGGTKRLWGPDVDVWYSERFDCFVARLIKQTAWSSREVRRIYCLTSYRA